MGINSDYLDPYNPDEEDTIRRKALELVTGALDFNRGDLIYQDICKDFSPGNGTTCSFLPHWMMLNIGVSSTNQSRGCGGRMGTLVNRNDRTRGTKLVPGDGIALIANSEAFVKFEDNPDAYPSMGDICVIESKNNLQDDEHVFVFLGKLSDTLWDTGETGQAFSKAPNGAIEGKRKERAMRIGNRSMIAVAAEGKPDRRVTGWLDISQLKYVEGSV